MSAAPLGALALAGACVAWAIDNNLTQRLSLRDPVAIVQMKAAGAALDFCDARTAWLVPARRICLPVDRDFAFNTLGFREVVPAVDFCEVQPDVLADAMRAVVAEDPASRRARGRAAAAHVQARWRWADSVAAVERRLADLREVRVPVRFRRERALQETQRRRFEVARALYVAGGGATVTG